MNSLDKLYIELYSRDGIFQGYAKHVSKRNRKIDSTQSKQDALSFSTIQAANNVVTKIQEITHGTLVCNIH